MKLNTKQRDILYKMANGWELAESTNAFGGAWIQKGGAGRGGESIIIHGNTLQALYTRGLIQQIYASPTAKFILTEIGLQEATK